MCGLLALCVHTALIFLLLVCNLPYSLMYLSIAQKYAFTTFISIIAMATVCSANARIIIMLLFDYFGKIIW